MSNTMRTVYRVTTDVASSALKKLLFTVLFLTVLASIATTSVVLFASRFVK